MAKSLTFIFISDSFLFLQCIGATTLDEYRKHIEKDPALERRFQPVRVPEPTVDETIQILRGLRERYEIHHKLRYTDEALEAAAKLSYQYIRYAFHEIFLFFSLHLSLILPYVDNVSDICYALIVRFPLMDAYHCIFTYNYSNMFRSSKLNSINEIHFNSTIVFIPNRVFIL